MISRNLIHNTVSEHVFIPEINPHCILSQIYALFIEFYYALFLFLFFKYMHYNTMIRKYMLDVYCDILAKDWEL
jgi:hypothetical protein